MGATYNNTKQSKWLLSNQIMKGFISEISLLGVMMKILMYLPTPHKNLT